MAVLGATRTAAALEVQTVTDTVYALVGPLEQHSPENLGNNATLGVVVTGSAVVLSDTGDRVAGARQIEAATKVDQAAFSHLPVFDQISRRNAQQVYMQVEWE